MEDPFPSKRAKGVVGLDAGVSMSKNKSAEQKAESSHLRMMHLRKNILLPYAMEHGMRTMEEYLRLE